MVAQDCSYSGFVIPLQMIAQENASIYTGTLAPVNLSCISFMQSVSVFLCLLNFLGKLIMAYSEFLILWENILFLAVFVATCEHVHVPLLKTNCSTLLFSERSSTIKKRPSIPFD